MALTSGQVTVGTAATQIDGASVNPIHLHIHNPENTKNIFLGNYEVTTASGLKLQGLDSMEITIFPGNSLYAISDNNNAFIHFLKQDM